MGKLAASLCFSARGKFVYTAYVAGENFLSNDRQA